MTIPTIHLIDHPTVNLNYHRQVAEIQTNKTTTPSLPVLYSLFESSHLTVIHRTKGGEIYRTGKVENFGKKIGPLRRKFLNPEIFNFDKWILKNMCHYMKLNRILISPAWRIRTEVRVIFSLLLIKWTPAHTNVTDLFVKHDKFVGRSLSKIWTDFCSKVLEIIYFTSKQSLVVLRGAQKC